VVSVFEVGDGCEWVFEVVTWGCVGRAIRGVANCVWVGRGHEEGGERDG